MRLLHRVGAVLALLAAYACGPTPATAATQLTVLPKLGSVTGPELIPCQIGGVTYVCTPAQIIAYANLGALQPLDADLTAIAALGTTSFGRSLLTMADAPTTRSTIGAAGSGANTDITSITGSAAKWTTARTISASGDVSWSYGVDGSANVTVTTTLATVNSAPGSCGGATAIPVLTINAKGLATACTATAISYLVPANNLSDLASAATARTNLGVTATGVDATYAYRANNLSDLANVTTARTNLGLGTAAVASTGTSGSTVPLLSGANTWSGAQTFSMNVQLGTSTSTGSAAPLYLDMGGTFSTTAGANPKMRLYDAGGNIYGFGVSSNQLDYMAPSAASHVFYVNNVEYGRINASGLTTTMLKMSAATTVSALSTCNTAARGTRTVVTDATAPTFLGTLTGGGSVVSPVFCNGTAWVAG